MNVRFSRGLRTTAPYDPNRIIQSLWIGDRLSEMEKLCIRSFIANGHEFHLYLYEKCEGVPEGTIVLDANGIIKESNITGGYHRMNSAFFSDAFRYVMLRQKERWWVDLDTICLRRFDFSDPYVFASEVSIDGLGMMVDNGILKAPRDSELLVRLSKETTPTTFGPGLMTELTKALDLRQYVRPPAVFTPIMPWLIPRVFIDPAVEVDLKDAYAVHMWNSSWKYTNKNAAYDPRCLYEKLKRQYPPR